jgi:hypothetical protein
LSYLLTAEVSQPEQAAAEEEEGCGFRYRYRAGIVGEGSFLR